MISTGLLVFGLSNVLCRSFQILQSKPRRLLREAQLFGRELKTISYGSVNTVDQQTAGASLERLKRSSFVEPIGPLILIAPGTFRLKEPNPVILKP